jgi:hypothetical protein
MGFKEREDFTEDEYVEMLYYYQEFLKSEGYTFEDFEKFLVDGGYGKPITRH